MPIYRLRNRLQWFRPFPRGVAALEDRRIARYLGWYGRYNLMMRGGEWYFVLGWLHFGPFWDLD